MKKDTILFDLDGTLINTNELIISSFLYTLHHYFPNQYKREDVIPFIGPPLIDSFKSVDSERYEEMVQMYRKHNTENHDTLVMEYEGVFETVEHLKAEGYQLAVVTTKMRPTVEQGLNLTKLNQFFDVVVTYNDVENVKPHPEPLYKALRQLGSSTERAIMVGDSQYDILAGKNAGVTTIGVGYSIKGRDFIQEQQPDFIIDTMPELIEVAKQLKEE